MWTTMMAYLGRRLIRYRRVMIRQLLLLSVFDEAELLQDLLHEISFAMQGESDLVLEVEVLSTLVRHLLLDHHENRIVKSEGQR